MSQEITNSFESLGLLSGYFLLCMNYTQDTFRNAHDSYRVGDLIDSAKRYLIDAGLNEKDQLNLYAILDDALGNMFSKDDYWYKQWRKDRYK